MARMPSARRGHLFTSVTTAALIAAAPMPALAQEGEDVITLLGRYRFRLGQPKVAIDTPQAVSVLDQQDLDAATDGER